MKSVPAQKRLAKYLETHRVRKSATRDRLLAMIQGITKHIELGEILKKAKAKGIAEISVYRSLKLFQDVGIVNRIQNQNGQTFYEISSEHHDHMICSKCSKIIEFQSEDIERIQNEIAKQHGFAVTNHRHELFGLCAACTAKDQ